MVWLLFELHYLFHFRVAHMTREQWRKFIFTVNSYIGSTLKQFCVVHHCVRQCVIACAWSVWLKLQFCENYSYILHLSATVLKLFCGNNALVVSFGYIMQWSLLFYDQRRSYIFWLEFGIMNFVIIFLKMWPFPNFYLLMFKNSILLICLVYIVFCCLFLACLFIC